MSQVSRSAPTSEPMQLDKRRVRVIIGALLLGMLLAALDQTIVATALPTIAGDLHGLSEISWVVTAYLLASTASTPLWGKLGDLYGRKVFFQAAIVIFLVGSVLSGISSSMFELIMFRAVQGIGGGGLMIGAQAIVGDVVAPRDRGRYQGVFGAVFGVASVIGPLLGGFLVDQLSWRWVFYVNVPIGILALAVTATALPSRGSRIQHHIDYAGTLLLAGGATSLVLLTTLGGVTYAWLSAPIATMAVAGVVLLVIFVIVERRAAEPVLPLRLFSERVFSVASAIGFVVGFAMFGAITYLPQYMQVVRGESPTESGLELLPLMAGLLLTSMGSGLLISRRGRYKVFPIVGTALMTVGLYLLSLLGVGSSALQSAAYMFVLGVGIGGVMQVLVIAVQNVVPYKDLGVATSGATFFRSIGGSFGTAVFGAIFANSLRSNLVHDLTGVHIPANFNVTAGASPAALKALPAPVHAGFIHAYAQSLHTVFLYATPIAAVAFLLTFLLKEVPLRRAASVPDQAQALAPSSMPAPDDAPGEVVRVLSLLSRAEDPARIYRELARDAGVQADPRSTWVLLRLEPRGTIHVPTFAARLGLSVDDVCMVLAALDASGLVVCAPAGGPPETALLTKEGREAVERLIAARRARLTALLGSWSKEQDGRLAIEIDRLARDLLRDEERRAAFLASSS